MPRIDINTNQRDSKNLSVGDTVDFHAKEECDLYFTNPDVFGTESVHLKPGKNSVDVKGDGTTTWNALSTPKQKAVRPDAAGSPNEIVVP